MACLQTVDDPHFAPVSVDLTPVVRITADNGAGHLVTQHLFHRVRLSRVGGVDGDSSTPAASADAVINVAG
jgi:hypothetical protein